METLQRIKKRKDNDVYQKLNIFLNHLTTEELVYFANRISYGIDWIDKTNRNEDKLIVRCIDREYTSRTGKSIEL